MNAYIPRWHEVGDPGDLPHNRPHIQDPWKNSPNIGIKDVPFHMGKQVAPIHNLQASIVHRDIEEPRAPGPLVVDPVY